MFNYFYNLDCSSELKDIILKIYNVAYVSQVKKIWNKSSNLKIKYIYTSKTLNKTVLLYILCRRL